MSDCHRSGQSQHRNLGRRVTPLTRDDGPGMSPVRARLTVVPERGTPHGARHRPAVTPDGATAHTSRTAGRDPAAASACASARPGLPCRLEPARAADDGPRSGHARPGVPQDASGAAPGDDGSEPAANGRVPPHRPAVRATDRPRGEYDEEHARPCSLAARTQVASLRQCRLTATGDASARPRSSRRLIPPSPARQSRRHHGRPEVRVAAWPGSRCGLFDTEQARAPTIAFGGQPTGLFAPFVDAPGQSDASPRS